MFFVLETPLMWTQLVEETVVTMFCVNVSWVMEFLTCGIKISLILSKRWMAFMDIDMM